MSLNKLFKDELRIRLKANTEVLLEDTDPLIVFSEHQLSREIQDDHLIASIIAFREQRSDTPVVLVTSDTGLLLQGKARKRHIESVVIPDDYKLPEEPDPLEKENRELKQQVRFLKNRIPDLKLCFAKNSDYIVCTLPKPAILSSDEIEHRMQEIRRQHPKLSNRRHWRDTPFDQAFAVLALDETGIALAQYNDNLNKYYKQYEAYIKYCSQYENIQRRTIKLNVSIVNEGTCPAENVCIRMHFPDGIELREEDVPPETIKPRPPSEPKTPIEKFEKQLTQQGSPYSIEGIFPGLYSLNPPRRYELPDISGPSIRKTNSHKVTYEKVTHHMPYPLDALYATFESFEDASSFHIDYKIYADNLPQAKSGQLHVRIEKGN